MDAKYDHFDALVVSFKMCIRDRAKGTPSPGWGQLGRGNGVSVKYVSINSGLGGDRL